MDKDKLKLDHLKPEQKRELLKKLAAERSQIPKRFPLTYGQRSLWHIQRLMPESSVYNVSLVWLILSDLNIPAIQKTHQWLLDRHPSLRTIYGLKDGEPYQEVRSHEEVYFKLHASEDWSWQDLMHEVDRETHRPFNLKKGPLLRINIYLRKEGEHLFHISFHHIAVDLWSSTYIFDEIAELYPIAVKGGSPPPLRSQIQYTDYVHWQQKMLAGPQGKKLWEYWKHLLEENIAPIRLPIQISEPLHQKFVGAAHPFKIDRELTARLRTGTQELGTTLFTLLLTGFETLLYLYSERETFLLRTLTVGRSRADLEKIVGFFANPVVLKADFSGNPTFREAVQRVQVSVTNAIAHQDYPFELLMEKIGFSSKTGINPNPEIMFILQTPQRFVSVRRDKQNISDYGIFAPGKTGIQLNLGGFVVEKFNPHQRVTLNDLAMEMAEVGNELSGVIHYRTDLYLPQSIARLTTHFIELMGHMAENFDLPISSFFPDDGFPKAEAKADQTRPYLRKALRDLHVQEAVVPPRNETEKKVAEIWEEVLGRSQVSIFENFFEQGGSSLQALQLITLIRERFQIELPLRLLFEVRTIAGISDALNNTDVISESPPIEPIWRDQDLTVSFAQQRLWFVDRLTGGHALYNIPIAVRLSGPLDIDHTRKVLKHHHQPARGPAYPVLRAGGTAAAGDPCAGRDQDLPGGSIRDPTKGAARTSPYTCSKRSRETL